MNIQNGIRKSWLNFLAALLLCGVMIALTLGAAYARYEAAQSEELKLTYEAKSEQIFIRSAETSMMAEDTETAENTSVLEFVLSNGNDEDNYCTYDQVATLSLLATVGLGNPEDFKITLTDGGSTYAASYTAVAEGTAMYSLYGPGWIYRFYNEAGEELSWQFSGTRLIDRQMMITVEGTSELPAALSLIANARPGE